MEDFDWLPYAVIDEAAGTFTVDVTAFPTFDHAENYSFVFRGNCLHNLVPQQITFTSFKLAA